MAKQRDVTALESLTSFSDSGYILVVQDSEIYALPKSIWTNEVHAQYESKLATWKSEFDAWYASVKGTFTNNDSQATDIATLKTQIAKCVMDDDGVIKKNDTAYLLPANSVKMDDGETVEASITSLQTTIESHTTAITGVGAYSELALENPISVASGVATTIQSITFTTAGTYLIDTDINFEANGNGIRVCKISPTTNDTEMSRSAVTTVPVTGVGTGVTFQTIVNVTAGKAYYINVRQTSGTALNVNSRCRIVKLANPNT